MRNFLQKITLFCLLFLLLTGSLFAAEESFIVRKGDSISLIAMKKYGVYSDRIGEIIAERNKIKNINLIFPNQRIILPEIDSKILKEEMFVEARRIVVSFLEGTVRYRENESDSWKELKTNQILTEGAEIETIRDGRVEMILDNKSILRLAPDSRVIIVGYSKEEQVTKTDISLPFGKIWTKITEFMSPTSTFNVHLTSTIVGVQGTIFRVDANYQGPSDIRVFKGSVTIWQKNPEGKINDSSKPVVVEELMKVSIDGAIISEVKSLDIADAEDKLFAWNTGNTEAESDQEELSQKIKLMYELKKKALDALK